MRKLELGSALALFLTVGAHGTSFASTQSPGTPEFWSQAPAMIEVRNDNELSNQARQEDSGDDSNGNNGGE